MCLRHFHFGPPSPSHPSKFSQSTGFGFPALISRFPLALYFMFSCYSLHSSYLLLPHYVQNSVLYVCVCFSVSFSVVSNSATPWTVAHQAPLSMGFSRQEYWSGLPFPYPGDLPNPGIEPRSPALQGDSLLSEPPWKPPVSPLLPCT